MSGPSRVLAIEAGPSGATKDEGLAEVEDAIRFSGVGVFGNGKGTLFPAFELGSQYNYQIPPELNPTPTHDKKKHLFMEIKFKELPWIKDPTLPDTMPKVLSVVGTANFGQPLELEVIAEKGMNLSFNAGSFTPLVMRMNNPVATGLVFRSGKIVVTGTQSEQECKRAAMKVAAQIRAIGFLVKPYGFKIQNITASCQVGFKIRVAHLGKDKLIEKGTVYNPEMFSGVSVSLINPKAKIMIFRTGSIIITGCRSEKDVEKAFLIIYPFLKAYAC